MSGTFHGYDTNKDNTISPAEWAEFYPDEGGPAQVDPGTAPAPEGEPFDFDEFMGRVSSGNFTDDDMLAFSNWYMGQQLGQQAGQMDYQSRYLDHLNLTLEGNNAALGQAQQEMEFQQGPYWDWYVEEFFPHEQQKDQWQFELAGDNFETQKYLDEGQRYRSDNDKYMSDNQAYMSDNQRLMSDIQKDIAGIDKNKSMDYATAQMYGTEQAKYAADAARWQYLQAIKNPPEQQSGTRRNIGSY